MQTYWHILHRFASLSSSHLTMLCSSNLFLFSSAAPGAAAADLRPFHTSRGFRASRAPSIDSSDRRDEADLGNAGGRGSVDEINELLEADEDKVGS